MARARLFKPTFFANAKLAQVSAHGRLLFVGLWTLADRNGRLKDEPRVIKGLLFPFENVPVDKLLGDLTNYGFITRYVAEGERLIQVTNFLKHQRPHPNESDSELAPMYEADAADGEPMVNQRTTKGEPSTTPTSLGSDSSSDSSSDSNSGSSNAEDAPTHPFSFLYSQKYRERSGHLLAPVIHGRALSLEQQYGAELCIQVAEEKGWDKHPSYYVGALKERTDGNANGANRGKSAASANTNGVASGVSDVDQRLAELAEQRRHRTI